jgi:hypothetical protein
MIYFLRSISSLPLAPQSRRYGRADMAADGMLNITSGVTHGGHM